MKGESQAADPAVHPLLCVLDCEDEGCHEELLGLAARVARGFGWPLRAGVAIDANLVRTAALPWVMRTGLESGRRRSFDRQDLCGHMESVRRRLRRRVAQIADSALVGEVVEGAEDAQEGIPGALVWWRLRHRLTLLLRGSEVSTGRGAVLLALREVTTEERQLVDKAAAILGLAGVVEHDFPVGKEAGEAGLPDPEVVATGLREGVLPGVLVVALPDEVGAEVALWIDGLRRRLGGLHVFVLR